MADGFVYNIGGGGDSGSGSGGVPPYANFAALPSSGNTLGDMAITTDDGNLYWWDGTAWVIPNAEVVTVGVQDTDSVDLSVVADKVQAALRLSGDAASVGNFKATSTIKSGGSPGLHVELPIATTSQTGVLTDTDWDTFNNKEPAITATTSADYYRGDKTFQTLNTAAVPELTNLYYTNARADARISLQKGAANGLATLDAGSKIPSAQLPAIAITDTFVVASEAAQTALTAQVGDVAVRTDQSKSYILVTEPASTFANWQELLSPTDSVTSVNGQTGVVVLSIANLQAIVNGSSASAGQINEVLSGTQAANTTTGVGASGAWGSATSVSLTAGRWAITGTAGFNENGAVLTDFMSVGISASATGVGISEFDTASNPHLISGSDLLLGTPTVLVSIASTTTYYLNTKFNYTSGTPQHRGRIQALRIG